MPSETVSLRELIDARFKAVEASIDQMDNHWAEIERQREAARKLALSELERRLEDLNHAHQRAAQILVTYQTREAFEKYREEDNIWKRQAEVLRASWVTHAEFLTYKETTQTALTLTAGKSQGVGSVWGMVVIGFSILAALGTISTAVGVFFRH